jgi:AraC-like DNA-binding protein
MLINSACLGRYLENFEIPVTVRVMESQNNTFIHAHEFCEVALVTAGTGTQRIYGKPPVEAAFGDLFVLPQGTAHGYANVNGMSVTNIIFSPEKIPIPEMDMGRFEAFKYLVKKEAPKSGKSGQYLYVRLSEDELKDFERIAAEIKKAERDKSPGNVFVRYRLLLELIEKICLCEYLKERCHVKYHYIDRAVEEINKSLMLPAPISALARKAGMSERNMRRQFKRSAGASPSHYLTGMRVRKGAEMLAGTNLPVGEIAVKCGFCDGNYFALKFRQVMGLSPKAYRKQQRDSDGTPQ